MNALLAKPLSYLPSLRDVLLRIGPVRIVFLASLLLSLSAVQTGSINRDGMLYVVTARAYLEGGMMAAFQAYPWPFMSIFMAWVAQVSGLGIETAGYLLGTLFMAGTYALLIDCAKRMFPEAIWYIVLVLLALPGLNSLRDELLREFGCWFFIFLTVWLALRWSDAPRWSGALALQGALVLSALFRPEALMLFPGLILWQWFSAEPEQRLRRVVMIGSLPALGLFVLIALLAAHQLEFSRLAIDIQRLGFANFQEKVDGLKELLPLQGREEAGRILFFGLLATVPLKVLAKMNLFALPLLYAFAGQSSWRLLARCSVFAWLFLAYLLALWIYVVDMQILTGRYVALLLLFAAPLTGVGFYRFIGRYPRWKAALVGLAVLIMLGKSVSLSNGKAHYAEAGAWLAKNIDSTSRIYAESGRAAYYAGWNIRQLPSPMRRWEAEANIERQAYDWVVLEVHKNAEPLDDWLERMGLREVQRFDSSDEGGVIIARPSLVDKENAP